MTRPAEGVVFEVLKMIGRNYEIYWSLKKLRNTTDRHTAEFLSVAEISAGTKTHDLMDGFVEWLADLSLARKMYQPYRRWIEKKIGYTMLKKKKVVFYSLIVQSCIENGYINKIKKEHGGKPSLFIATSTLGDEYVSDFWYKQLLGPLASLLNRIK